MCYIHVQHKFAQAWIETVFFKKIYKKKKKILIMPYVI